MAEQKQQQNEVLIKQTLAAINMADEAAALERVRKLRELYPEAAPEALVGMLIKQKCLQTGAIGQVSSSSSIIPEVGVFVSLIFGEAADVMMTAKMQAELVLEIATAYQAESQLGEAAKQEALVMVTGSGGNANRLLAEAGSRLAQQATTHLKQIKGTTSTEVSVTETAGQNLLSTYLIGRRANTYFKLGPEAVAPWAKETVVAAEEATLTQWLSETTQRSWDLLANSTLNLTDTAIVAGKAIGEVLLVKATDLALSQQMQQGFAVTTATAAKLPPTVTKLGGGVLAGLGLAGKVASEAGRGLAKGVVLATDVAGDASRKAGEGVASGLGKVGQLISGVLPPEAEDEENQE
jgi:hypothetical protein